MCYVWTSFLSLIQNCLFVLWTKIWSKESHWCNKLSFALSTSSASHKPSSLPLHAAKPAHHQHGCYPALSTCSFDTHTSNRTLQYSVPILSSPSSTSTRISSWSNGHFTTAWSNSHFTAASTPTASCVPNSRSSNWPTGRPCRPWVNYPTKAAAALSCWD